MHCCHIQPEGQLFWESSYVWHTVCDLLERCRWAGTYPLLPEACTALTYVCKLSVTCTAVTRYGTVYLFKDYSDNLYVTVALTGRANGQPFFTLPNVNTGARTAAFHSSFARLIEAGRTQSRAQHSSSLVSAFCMPA